MKAQYVYWRDEDFWIGYLADFPDYRTQGSTLDELKENLRELYKDLNSGTVPCIRKIDELEVA